MGFLFFLMIAGGFVSLMIRAFAQNGLGSSGFGGGGQQPPQRLSPDVIAQMMRAEQEMRLQNQLGQQRTDMFRTDLMSKAAEAGIDWKPPL